MPAIKINWERNLGYWREMCLTMSFDARHAVMDAWAAIDVHATSCWFVPGKYSDQDRAVDRGIVFG